MRIMNMSEPLRHTHREVHNVLHAFHYVIRGTDILLCRLLALFLRQTLDPDDSLIGEVVTYLVDFPLVLFVLVDDFLLPFWRCRID